MILISAHKDVVMHPYRLAYKNGTFTGLLDNYIGMLVCNSLLVEDPAISTLEQDKKIGFYYGDGEEWALTKGFPKLPKGSIVVVVDVACGNQYKNIDFSLENISHFKDKEVEAISEHLKWEGFRVKTKVFDGNPDDEDEAWKWAQLGYKTLSLIIPIESGSSDTGWHVDDCRVSIEKIIKCKNGLRRLINYLV